MSFEKALLWLHNFSFQKVVFESDSKVWLKQLALRQMICLNSLLLLLNVSFSWLSILSFQYGILDEKQMN